MKLSAAQGEVKMETFIPKQYECKLFGERNLAKCIKIFLKSSYPLPYLTIQ